MLSNCEFKKLHRKMWSWHQQQLLRNNQRYLNQAAELNSELVHQKIRVLYGQSKIQWVPQNWFAHHLQFIEKHP